MAEAPSRRISTREDNPEGTVFTLTDRAGVPNSLCETGCGGMRRPLTSTSVLPEPRPRRSIDVLSPRALWPADSCSLRSGGLAIVIVSKRSADVGTGDGKRFQLDGLACFRWRVANRRRRLCAQQSGQHRPEKRGQDEWRS